MSNLPTYKAALAFAGSLSAPSKMPCASYSLPTYACKVGNNLMLLPDSVCYSCYATRGNYRFEKVVNAMDMRLAALTSDIKYWEDCMVVLIYNEGDEYFRWHDSGDVQSREHLNAIVNIAKRLPHVKFWLPTREYALIKQLDSVPENLTIRVSYPLIGIPKARLNTYPNTSIVVKDNNFEGLSDLFSYGETHVCPARTQNNKCASCRACWEKEATLIIYHQH